MAMSEKQVLTVPEVAKIFGLHQNAIYAAVKRGDLPFCRVGDRIFFSPKAIESFIQGNNTPACSGARS